MIFLISNKVSQLDSRLFSPICFGWSNAIIICIHYAIYHKYSWGAYFPPIEHTVRCTLNMLTNRTIDYTREPVYLNPGLFLATIFSLKITTWGGQYFLFNFIFHFSFIFSGKMNQHTNLFPLYTEPPRPGTGNKPLNIFILIIFGIGFKCKSTSSGDWERVTTVQRASMKFDKWSPGLCRFIGYPPARNILKGSNYLSVGFAKGIQTIFITVIVFSNEIFFFPYRIIVYPCQHS